jgi:NitT/TauT family transport system substrate-binding protein
MTRLLLLLACLASQASAEKVIIRAGHFPNVTHAQGMIAHHLSRQGKGWFEERLGSDVKITWFVYNAGPTSMEAIFAKSLDLTYVGPNPAINAHLRSRGEEIRIVAGACSGGAALVVQPDRRIKSPADFKGRTVGTPQFGNTQDVAARAWLRAQGYRITWTGGDVQVVPASGADQLALFKRGQLDAAWTIEPWVSRLVQEAQATVYLEEGETWPETNGRYVTTHLVSSTRFLQQQPGLLKKWIAAHVELTEWINQNPDEAKRLLNAAMRELTTRELPEAVLHSAWERLELTHDPVRQSLLKSAQAAHSLGFIRREPDLSRIYDLRLLNQVLREKSLPEIP